jgi:carbon storage regulator
MLVLTRRPSESIIIAGNIKITVVSVGPGRVKLGIEAPPNVRIDRQEIHEKLEQAADVLSAIGGEAASPDAQGTFIGGPDTAVVVPAAPAEQPAVPVATPVAAATAPALPMGKLSKYRLPRKPR